MPFRPIEPSKPADPAPIFVRARTRPPPLPAEEEAETPSPEPQPEATPRNEAARRLHVVDRSGPNWDEHGDYIVGKGRPPREHQWKPRQSGNPKGPKPREVLDPETEMDNAILAEFGTTVNGQQINTNLGLFALNVLKAKAAQKDRKAAADLLDLYYTKLRARSPLLDGAAIPPEEQAIIDALLDAAGWEVLPPIRNRLTPVDEPETEDE